MEGKFMQFNVRGMTRDLSLSKFSPEFAYEMKNLRVESVGRGSLFSLTNEIGQKRITLTEREEESFDILIYGNVSIDSRLIDNTFDILIYGNVFEQNEIPDDIEIEHNIRIFGTINESEGENNPPSHGNDYLWLSKNRVNFPITGGKQTIDVITNLDDYNINHNNNAYISLSKAGPDRMSIDIIVGDFSIVGSEVEIIVIESNGITVDLELYIGQ
jgi:hypothetical protein